MTVTERLVKLFAQHPVLKPTVDDLLARLRDKRDDRVGAIQQRNQRHQADIAAERQRHQQAQQRLHQLNTQFRALEKDHQAAVFEATSRGVGTIAALEHDCRRDIHALEQEITAIDEELAALTAS
jgi:hypothetical protein